ncbi:MAG TPA: ATP synthase F1 subunit gamma [Planctomycetaceae bacterium]|nr:ATP synthase F1 subunit gamma [Planctomycetaceae bacterium]HIQ22640.1 ATP synthase F1 subunit gamma [Planctomycetota bacterium]
MVKARTLDRRRKSIRNIRKITRTMELIATARFKRAMDRAVAATAYTRRITALVGHLARSGLEVSHPLLEPRPEPTRAALLVVTANRGLCGGYNAAVLRLAYAQWDALAEQAPERQLDVVGKRGIAAFRFHRIEMDRTFTDFHDRPPYEQVERLANGYLDAFQSGRLDRLDIVYTRFHSLSRQEAVVETLLPLSALEEEEEPPAEVQYEFLPSAESILDEVVPASFKVRLFKCFLDAAVSEQIARMMAMKAATENADTMIRNLTMTYNRARQTQITSELLEVISGAEALEQ